MMSVALRVIEGAGPSEQKTLQFLHEHPLGANLSDKQRSEWIAGIARQLRVLESDERQRIFMNPMMRRYISQMKDAEKARFLETTLAAGIPEAMQGFSTAPRERRLRWLSQALNELEQNSDDLPMPLDDAAIERIAEKGLVAHWADADVATRIELQPFLERLQAILQIPR
jgi:hypothetical protein